MNDPHPGQLPDDSQSSITPRSVLTLLWQKMAPYFSKYQLKFAGAWSNTPLAGPSIVWGIHSRVPGNAKGVAQSRGPTHSKMRDAGEDGLVAEELMQYHTVVYEYKIVGSSTDEANEISWDLENFIRIAAGSVAEELPGFTINFQEELGERNMTRNAQDDALVRVLRFIAQVPVKYDRYHYVLRQIQHKIYMGRVQVTGGRVTRTDASTRYDVPVDGGQRVNRILAVYKFNSDNTTTHLHESIDFSVKVDPDTKVLYIQWDDDFGTPPSVGQDFRVDYMLSYLRTVYQNE